VLAVVRERLGGRRVDHERAVLAELLLEARVAVVPVRAVLAQGIAVLEGRPGRDARERHARHAVHLVGEQDPVPVHGRVLVEPVRHADDRVVALAVAEHGARERSVDRDRAPLALADRDPRLAHDEVERPGRPVEHARHPAGHAPEHATGRAPEHATGRARAGRARPGGHERIHADHQAGRPSGAEERPTADRPGGGRRAGGRTGVAGGIHRNSGSRETSPLTGDRAPREGDGRAGARRHSKDTPER
jgi:hypothetical protein